MYLYFCAFCELLCIDRLLILLLPNEEVEVLKVKETFLDIVVLLYFTLHLYITMHIPNTVLYTFPKVLIRRIWVTINGFFSQ